MSEGSLIEDIKRDIEELLTAKRAAKSEISFDSKDYSLKTQNAIQEILKDLKQKETQLQLNIKSIPIFSHRRFLGPLFNLYKRIIRISTEWLYQPVFNNLANFNSEIVDLLKKIVIDRSKIHRELEMTRKRLQLAVHELTNQIGVEKDHIQQKLNDFWKNEFKNAIDNAHNELTQTKQLLENYHAESSFLRTKLSLALEQKDQNFGKSSEDRSDDQNLERGIPQAINDAIYFSFEQKFRGTEEDIKERQKVYLPYLKTAFEKCNDPILDLGSGRGEFLELCREANLSAKGVDINDAMIEHCQQKNFNVEKIDLFKYLQTLQDESLSAITAFQLVEHLTPEKICFLVKLCSIKLKSEGIIILETMNPDNFASLRHFYLDLSHQKPIPSETLRFILEASGFKKVEVLFSSPVPAKYCLKGEDENTRILNNLLLGHQDYAVLGWK